MKKSKLLIFLAVLFSGLSCACTQPKTASESPIKQTDGKITFSVGSKVGDHFVMTAKAKFVYGGDASAKMEFVRTEDQELTKIENGLYTWKVITTFKPEHVGKSIAFSEDAGFRENRITLKTVNRYGNLVSEEGSAPNDEQYYRSVPENPVKIGDSWSGYSMKGEKKGVTTYYTLEAIEMVNGIECAVVTLKYKADGLNFVGKDWIGISTGVTYKSQGTATGLNNAKQKAEGSFSALTVSR